MNFSKSKNYRKNSKDYWKIECRSKGFNELGVLRAQPYKNEILPYWRFKTPEEAEESSEKIYRIFKKYKSKDDSVGMDMARKYLQMGYTRSMRYYYHSDGKKYDKNGSIKPNKYDHKKKKSAKEFLKYFKLTIKDPKYLQLRKENCKSS